MKRGNSKLLYRTHWERAKELIAEFRHDMSKIESEMQTALGNTEIEFVIEDGKLKGIRDEEKLIMGQELEAI